MSQYYIFNDLFFAVMLLYCSVMRVAFCFNNLCTAFFSSDILDSLSHTISNSLFILLVVEWIAYR